PNGVRLGRAVVCTKCLWVGLSDLARSLLRWIAMSGVRSHIWTRPKPAMAFEGQECAQISG
ncbi:MAG: hypothetical protein WCF35_24750, partial [Pseudolabrys sp.]